METTPCHHCSDNARNRLVRNRAVYRDDGIRWAISEFGRARLAHIIRHFGPYRKRLRSHQRLIILPLIVFAIVVGVVGYVLVTTIGGGFVYSAEYGTYVNRSEEHTSELQSLTDISYAVFCLKKKK